MYPCDSTIFRPFTANNMKRTSALKHTFAIDWRIIRLLSGQDVRKRRRKLTVYMDKIDLNAPRLAITVFYSTAHTSLRYARSSCLVCAFFVSFLWRRAHAICSTQMFACCLIIFIRNDYDFVGF